LVDPAAPLTIGGENATSSDFDGKLDDVRLYTRSLSSSDVAELYGDAGSTVTVTNTLDNINGNTSSVSALIASDGGDGISLREAITASNAQSDSNTIEFSIGTGDTNYIDPDAITTNGDEYWNIALSSALPDITWCRSEWTLFKRQRQ